MSGEHTKRKSGFSRLAKDSVSFFRRHKRHPAYPYQPLGPADIRLLNILPGGPEDQISCTLDQVSLDDGPDYDALSYVWGPPTLPMKKILLEGEQVDVTQSLHSALWQFRELTGRSYEKRYLWVDAKCLNQEDQAELAQQVPRMKDIYSKANNVVIWLGFNTVPDREIEYLKEEMESAAEWFQQKLQDPSTKNGNIIHEYPSKDRLREQGQRLRPAFKDLWEQPWFTRMWVVQEAILAQKDPVVYFGRNKMQLRAMGIFDMFTFELLERKDQLALMEITSISERYKNWNLQDANQATLEQRVAGMLEQSLTHLVGRDQGRAHDRVYGLLGLAGGVARGPLPQELMPDYDLPLGTVFHQYVCFIIRHTGSLSLLPCFTRDLPGTVPSWVPDLRNLNTQFRNPTGLVSLSDDNKEMTVEGSALGVVKAQVPPWDPETDPSADNGAWTPIVQDRKAAMEEIIFRPATQYQGKSTRDIWQDWIYYNDKYKGTPTMHDSRSFDAVANALANLAEPTELTRIRREVLEGLKCSHLLLDNDMTFQVLRDVKVREGDVVYQIRGLDKPVILRSDRKGSYQLVGHGVMMDSGFRGKDEPRSSQKITLV